MKHLNAAASKLPDTVEVTFDPAVPVDYASVIAMKTFILAGGPVAAPKIVAMPNNVARFHSLRPLKGQYVVRLLDQIVSATLPATRLDGELPSTGAWPSGNDVPGGSFAFELLVS